MQGWLTKTISSVRPAPVAVYQARGKTITLMYVMAPSRAGAGDLVQALEAVPGDPMAGRVSMKDGRTYEVRFQPGKPAAWRLMR